MWKRAILAGIISITLVAACVPTLAEESASAPLTASATSPAPALASTAQADPATLSPSPLVDDTALLSADGPWLVFPAYVEEDDFRYLWAVNDDGTGLTRLSEHPVSQFAARYDRLTGEGLIAFITSSHEGDPLFGALTDLQLHLARLPDLEDQTITALISSETALRAPGEDDPLNTFMIARSITEVHPLDWSPDGRRLAFVGAMDGPSADVYVYSLDTHAISRLTSGPDQVYDVTWSPDGQYVAHIGVIEFGSGAGFDLAPVWAARSDGSGSVFLYDPASYGSIYEDIVGWRDPATIITATQETAVRIIDLNTGAITTLFEHQWVTAFDPTSGTLLFTRTSAEYGNPLDPGIFLFAPDDPAPHQVSDTPSTGAFWSAGAHMFIVLAGDPPVQNQSVLGVIPSGEVITLPGPRYSAYIAVTADGLWWAWPDPGSGILIGEAFEKPLLRVGDATTFNAVWSPDGTRLFFFQEDGFYTYSVVDQTVQLIEPALRQMPGWDGQWIFSGERQP